MDSGYSIVFRIRDQDRQAIRNLHSKRNILEPGCERISCCRTPLVGCILNDMNAIGVNLVQTDEGRITKIKCR
jgi:hypothetical protein